MKRKFLNLFIGLFITIIFFVFLEIAARKINTTALKDKIEKSDLRTKLEKAYIPPFAKKDPQELRVFVYGGSTVQGLPLPKVGFASQLDYQLHHIFGEKNSVRLYNFGWSGYNSTVIRHLVKRTVREKPDLLIVYSGHNEFIYSQLDSYFLIKTLSFLRDKSGLIKLLLTLKEDRQQNQESLDEKVDEKRPAFRKQKIFYPLKMLIFRENMKAVVKLAQQEKIPLIFCTAASNLADWPPVERKVTTLPETENYQEKLDQLKELIKENLMEKAQKNIKPLLEKYPNDASLFYLQAKIASQSGQPMAGYFFIKAKDLDLISWRATSTQNEFIRSLADQNGVWVADVEKELFSHSPNNLTGFNFMTDNVHPTKEGSYFISRTIINLLKKEKLVKKDWWAKANAPYSLDEFLQRVGFSPEDELEILFSSAKYCVKNPFFNFAAAKACLDKAEKIEENWQIKALRASLAFLQNKQTEAEEFLEKAESLQGFPLSENQIKQIPYLNQFYPSLILSK